MVYVLVGERGSREVRPPVWHDALDLAARSGWSPRGTLRGRGWGGCYVAPCGQLVVAEDAGSMALALEGSLDDLPDHEAPESAGARSLFERLGGARKVEVEALISLLRGGAFTIFGRCDLCGGPDGAR